MKSTKNQRDGKQTNKESEKSKLPKRRYRTIYSLEGIVSEFSRINQGEGLFRNYAFCKLHVLNNITPDDKTDYMKAVTLFLLHDYAEALEIMENISCKNLDASRCGTPARY